MPSVNFDDQYPINRKVDGLSDAAFRLHTSAIFWCFRNTTDGFIPAEDLELVCPRVRSAEKLAAECVRRRVWHEAGEPCTSEHCPAKRQPDADGWVIHDYLQYQPSKDEARAERNGKSDGGSLGNHRRWHAGKGITKPGCPYCLAIAEPSDNRSDSESHAPVGTRSGDQLGSESYARGSISISTKDPSVVSHLQDRNAQALDDSILRTTIDCVRERTGVALRPDEAESVAAQILSGRRTRSPAAYIRKAIRDEPNPGARFLPREAPPPVPPWCGKCDEGSRLRELDNGTMARCPDCHPLRRAEAAS